MAVPGNASLRNPASCGAQDTLQDKNCRFASGCTSRFSPEDSVLVTWCFSKSSHSQSAARSRRYRWQHHRYVSLLSPSSKSRNEKLIPICTICTNSVAFHFHQFSVTSIHWLVTSPGEAGGWCRGTRQQHEIIPGWPALHQRAVRVRWLRAQSQGHPDDSSLLVAAEWK